MSEPEAISELKKIILEQAKQDAQYVWEDDFYEIKEELVAIGNQPDELLEFINDDVTIVDLEDHNMDAALERECMFTPKEGGTYKELYHEIDGWKYYFQYFRDEIVRLMTEEKE